MEERELIGRGRTADVYAWSPGEVVKLYHPWWPLSSIRYEAEMGRAVHAAGLPAPRIGDIVEVEGQHGLVLQRSSPPGRACPHVRPATRFTARPAWARLPLQAAERF
jgi:hypothetical protein